jgi:ankyrin repeat protein
MTTELSSYKQEYPLHVACGSSGDLELVKYLIEVEKHNPNLADSTGFTPLHYACRYNHLEIVIYLNESVSCDKEVQDDNGNRPLHLA